jgi:hypothetical protein
MLSNIADGSYAEPFAVTVPSWMGHVEWAFKCFVVGGIFGLRKTWPIAARITFVVLVVLVVITSYVALGLVAITISVILGLVVGLSVLLARLLAVARLARVPRWPFQARGTPAAALC